MRIVQSYIAPVVRLQKEGETIRFARLCGTAFFVNSLGAFITAAHVIRDANTDVERYGGGFALCVRKPGDSDSLYVGHIQGISFADEPYDIAVGHIAERTSSCFVLRESEKAWLWDDVYTAGYAESAVSRGSERIRSDVRGLKGYLVRKVPPGEHLANLGKHPAAFEVNFSIPHCMSGSPLVLRWGPSDEPDEGVPLRLLGVCVATATVKIGDAVEQYGVAHDLLSLKDWKPECFAGETLGEGIRMDEHR